MIEVEGLQRRFAQGRGRRARVVQAVADARFVAADGRITGLLGSNGAGKTTTLRMVAALVAPDAGRVVVDGIQVAQRPAAALARLGVLSDARGLYPRLTARENVRYFGRLHGLAGADLEARIDRLLKLLEMSEIADRRAEGFSTGERLKVAIARALVHGPRNVLLDEPTNGLDVMSTRAMRDVIRRLRADGHCVLFSSHIMQEVAALCDQIVIMAHGKVAAVGTADELRRQTGQASLEDAFVSIIGSEAGLER